MHRSASQQVYILNLFGVALDKRDGGKSILGHGDACVIPSGRSNVAIYEYFCWGLYVFMSIVASGGKAF